MSALTAPGFPPVIRAYHEKHRAVNHVMEENEHIRKAIHKKVRTNHCVKWLSNLRDSNKFMDKPSFGYTNYVEF